VVQVITHLVLFFVSVFANEEKITHRVGLADLRLYYPTKSRTLSTDGSMIVLAVSIYNSKPPTPQQLMMAKRLQVYNSCM
jgi:hypothetical protein